MSGVLKRLLLLPVLAPLVAVGALVLLNPRPAVALRRVLRPWGPCGVSRNSTPVAAGRGVTGGLGV